MRKPSFLLVFALGLAAPAAAQPVTEPTRCEVTISRAPDDVRAQIEAWVAAEPRCATTLDVRVVPTDGGYYLFARDAAGHVRERLVPDAQSAGVLVASWVADDGIAPPSTTPPPVDPMPVVAPAEPTAPPPAVPVVAGAMAPGAMAPVVAGSMAPGATAPVVAPPVADGNLARRAPAGRYLTVAGMVQPYGEGVGGLRAELDLRRRGAWSLGLVLSVAAGHYTLHALSASWMNTTDGRLLAVLTRTSPIGRRWDMRLSAGAGLLGTHATGEYDGDSIEAQGVSPALEGSVLLARELRGGWAATAGLLATWTSQKFMQDGMQVISRADVELMVLGGIRRRL